MALFVTVWEDSGPVVSSKGTTRTQVTNIGWKSSGLDESNHYVYNPIIRPEEGSDIPFTYSYKKYNFMKIAGTYPLGSRPRIKITGDYTGAAPQGDNSTIESVTAESISVTALNTAVSLANKNVSEVVVKKGSNMVPSSDYTIDAEAGTLTFTVGDNIGTLPANLKVDYKYKKSEYQSTGAIRLFYKLTNIYEQPNSTWDGSLMYIAPGETKILYPAVSTTGPEAATSYLQYLTANATYYSQYLVTQLVVEQGTEVDFGNIGELNIEWYMDEYEGTNV